MRFPTKFPASYSFDKKMFEEIWTVRGVYQDEWQYVLESVELESGKDITNQLPNDLIADLESEGSMRYGEYATLRMEEMAERNRDR